MKKVKILGMSLAVISVLGIGLTGCGGGGGNTGATLAKANMKNALEVEKRVARDQDSNVYNSRNLNNANTNSRINIGLLANVISQSVSTRTSNIELNSYSLNQAIDSNTSCTDGGTISYQGTVEENNGKTDASIKMIFTQCNEDDEIWDGIVDMSMSGYDLDTDAYDSMSMYFLSDFSMNNKEIGSITFYAKSSLTEDVLSPSKRKQRVNIDAIDGEGKKYKLDFCTFYYNYGETTYEQYQDQGKVYINELNSYVEYDTSYKMENTPFVFTHNSDIPISGEARYRMADNATMKVVIENTPKTSIDIDNDGIFELDEDSVSNEPEVKGEEKNKDEEKNPSSEVTRADISKKNYVLILENTYSDLCNNDYIQYINEEEEYINPIFKEESRRVTCTTYGKNEGRECHQHDEGYEGNIYCVVGFDSFANGR